jgi:hypothetical protein
VSDGSPCISFPRSRILSHIQGSRIGMMLSAHRKGIDGVPVDPLSQANGSVSDVAWLWTDMKQSPSTQVGVRRTVQQHE